MPRPPMILALDFDGVLCEGTREYFESSRRAYLRAWPDSPPPADDLLPRFRELRPVIETGWEMPVLLRALALGADPPASARAWPAARDALLDGHAAGRTVLVERLKMALDEVRREWIATDQEGWLTRHGLYCDVSEVRRLVAEPEQVAIVTTKEGEFTRQLLEHWGIPIVDIQGKESGSHKCDNLRQLIADFQATRGRRPTLWFVEDRLETLRCVTTHPDLATVRLFLAAWGYNTPETRATVSDDPRICLLTLDCFRRGLSAWT